jgi:hypothetical protein
MNQSPNDRISQLREELISEIQATTHIDQIVNQKIDREFPFDMTRVSNSELDSEIHKRMVEVNNNLFYVKHKFNAKFQNNRILSTRIFNNKPVKFLLYPFFLFLFLPRRIGRVFESFILIHQLLPYRFHRFNQTIQELEEKIKALEFNKITDEK